MIDTVSLRLPELRLLCCTGRASLAFSGSNYGPLNETLTASRPMMALYIRSLAAPKGHSLLRNAFSAFPPRVPELAQRITEKRARTTFSVIRTHGVRPARLCKSGADDSRPPACADGRLPSNTVAGPARGRTGGCISKAHRTGS